MEKQSPYSRHTHANVEGKSLPYGHHLLGFHGDTLFNYWGLGLRRRLRLLGDATVALLFERCKWGECGDGGAASLQILLAI